MENMRRGSYLNKTEKRCQNNDAVFIFGELYGEHCRVFSIVLTRDSNHTLKYLLAYPSISPVDLWYVSLGKHKVRKQKNLHPNLPSNLK